MKVLGFSGRAQAGKNSLCNWLSGLELQRLGLVDYSYVNQKGELVVPLEVEGATERMEGPIDLIRPNEYYLENIYPWVKIYSFADHLKRFCMAMFDLTWEQCYGTDEDKNTPTKLLWENFLPFLVQKNKGKKKEELPIGFMSARDVLQAFGTDIVRKIFAKAWVTGLVKTIKLEQCEFALVCDCRFPDEVAALQEIGGKVIRLTRNPLEKTHESEIALDKENFDWTKFDAIVDNQNMTIEEQNKATWTHLKSWDWNSLEIEEVKEPINDKV